MRPDLKISFLVLRFILIQKFFICTTSKRFSLVGDELWPTEQQVDEFISNIKGIVLVDGRVNYIVPFTWNLRTNSPRPSFIVKPLDDRDIAASLHFARNHTIRVSVMSTGFHQDVRNSVDQSLLIDLSGFRSLAVDEAARSFTVGPGLPFADIVAAVHARDGAGDEARRGAREIERGRHDLLRAARAASEYGRLTPTRNENDGWMRS